MLKRQLKKLLQYTDYLKQIQIIEENVIKKKHITKKVLKITIIN